MAFRLANEMDERLLHLRVKVLDDVLFLSLGETREKGIAQLRGLLFAQRLGRVARGRSFVGRICLVSFYLLG